MSKHQCKGYPELAWLEDLLKYMCPCCGQIVGQPPDPIEDPKRLKERLNLKPGEIIKNA